MDYLGRFVAILIGLSLLTILVLGSFWYIHWAIYAGYGFFACVGPPIIVAAVLFAAVIAAEGG